MIPSRIDVLKLFLVNNRTRDYEKTLRNGLERKYRFGGISDFLRYSGTEPFVILRHDIDQPHQGIEELLEIEGRLNVASSWYFRWSTAESDVIERISERGGEAGLHYETLGRMCEEKGIISTEEITEELMELSRKRLVQEVQDFRERFSVPCLTIASHGHPRNRLVGMANNQILTSELRGILGIEAEAYDSAILDRVESYVSDCNPAMNGGWAYSVSLEEAILDGCQTICFLSHPQHWVFTTRQRVFYAAKVLFQGVNKVKRTFRPRYASSYKRVSKQKMSPKNAEELKDEYNKNYQQAMDKWSINDLSKARSIISTLLEYVVLRYLPCAKGKRSLDVGCAKGHFTEALRLAGFESVGLDYSDVAIELARSNFPDCRFIVMDGFNPRFDTMFDFIFVRGFSGANTYDLDFVANFSNRYISYLNPGGLYVLAFTSDFSGTEPEGATACWSHQEIDVLSKKIEATRVAFLLIPRKSFLRKLLRDVALRVLRKQRAKDYFYLVFQSQGSF